MTLPLMASSWPLGTCTHPVDHLISFPCRRRPGTPRHDDAAAAAGGGGHGLRRPTRRRFRRGVMVAQTGRPPRPPPPPLRERDEKDDADGERPALPAPLLLSPPFSFLLLRSAFLQLLRCRPAAAPTGPLSFPLFLSLPDGAQPRPSPVFSSAYNWRPRGRGLTSTGPPGGHCSSCFRGAASENHRRAGPPRPRLTVAAPPWPPGGRPLHVWRFHHRRPPPPALSLSGRRARHGIGLRVDRLRWGRRRRRPAGSGRSGACAAIRSRRTGFDGSPAVTTCPGEGAVVTLPTSPPLPALRHRPPAPPTPHPAVPAVAPPSQQLLMGREMTTGLVHFYRRPPSSPLP